MILPHYPNQINVLLVVIAQGKLIQLQIFKSYVPLVLTVVLLELEPKNSVCHVHQENIVQQEL